jgi:hypothetical protein
MGDFAVVLLPQGEGELTRGGRWMSKAEFKQMSEITQVGRSYGVPGGGFEMQFPYRMTRMSATTRWC